MVGKQVSSDKNTPSLTLGGLVPKTNFYRRLKQVLDLDFLYSVVEPCYGKCGQQSIDPIVFFKLLLVGHLENLVSDGAIIRTSQLRLDILYFLDYSVEQLLPWHSTLSRTRQRLPSTVFEAGFAQVLSQCVQAGMVSGDTQAIDSALVVANASLDNLKAKSLADWNVEKNDEPLVPSPDPLSAAFKRIVNPYKVARNNRTHQSHTDAQARLAQKPGKPFRLYYLSSMAVDTAGHVITHIQADLADEKDSRHLLAVVDKTQSTLQGAGLPLQCVLADGGFSSGENYASLEGRALQAYIASNGVNQPQRSTFTYDEQGDMFTCAQGKLLHRQGIRMANGSSSYTYYAKRRDCQTCPLKAACCGKATCKRLTVTAFRGPYQRMQARQESPQGGRMRKLRSSTVEPVFGSLINYFGLRRINGRGKAAAHKRMLMAAMAYNLQKYLAFKGHPVSPALVLTCSATNENYFFAFFNLPSHQSALPSLGVVQQSPPFFCDSTYRQKGESERQNYQVVKVITEIISVAKKKTVCPS